MYNIQREIDRLIGMQVTVKRMKKKNKKKVPREDSDTIWITNEGERIPIVDMETSHLRNCIPFIERKINAHIIKKIEFAKQQIDAPFTPHSEAASLEEWVEELEDKLRNLSDRCYEELPIYANMWDELRKRDAS